MSVPKLRFPEFRSDGEWEEKKLLDVSIPVEERAGSAKHTLMSVTSGIGLISQVDKFGREIAGNAYKNYYVIRKGDFAYNKSATKQYPEGYISRLIDYESAALPNSIFTCFRVTDPESYPPFYNHLFHDNLHGKYLRKFISVGARAHGSLNVDSDDLMRMPILLPRLREQQKIADCLSSLDDMIAAHNQKLISLKTHKKGLMQQLFPAEGETIPKLRFKEFRDKGDWDSNELQKFSTIIRGASPRPQGDPRYFGGAVPRLMGKDVSRDGKWVTPCTDFLTEEGAELSRFCKKGTLTIICSGDVGVPSFLAIDACIHDGFLALIDIDLMKTSEDFLFYSLVNLQQLFSESATHGGVFVNLTTTILKEFKIPMPSLPEQQKIADCLSSLDTLIGAQCQKIEALKQHKKGLMQQLFPQTEEAGA